MNDVAQRGEFDVGGNLIQSFDGHGDFWQMRIKQGYREATLLKSNADYCHHKCQEDNDRHA